MDGREELQAEMMGAFGDPRRCPRHGEAISSPDGMFDGLCGACESEMDQDAMEESKTDLQERASRKQAVNTVIAIDRFLAQQAMAPLKFDAEQQVEYIANLVAQWTDPDGFSRKLAERERLDRQASSNDIPF